MKLAMQSFSNLWFANGAEVSNVIIFDCINGVLLDTQRRWLDNGSRSIVSLPQIGAVAARNKVNLAREEHFVCKGVLYLNAALFSGYSTVGIEYSTSSEGTQSCDRKYIDINWAIDDRDADWYRVTEQCYGNYELTAIGHKAQAVLELFNKEVTYSSRQELSLSQAARLVALLPELAEAAAKA